MTLDQNVLNDVLRLLDDVLGLNGRAKSFVPDTPLLGALPELDSMAVVGLLTSIEEHYGFTISDDEIDGSIFADVASLSRFIQAKLDD